MQTFKTESKKLLDLMINSIYTNKEIFLRELISNASDAEDKLYFKSLTDKSIELSRNDLTIGISFDKDARTVTVSDHGIGMDRDALEKNLGTIAHSDSQEFKAAQAAAEKAQTDQAASEGDKAAAEGTATKDAVDIIGQFGVGFYSAFMVAKEVRVVTKPYGSKEAWEWTSDGVEGYTIEPAEKEGFGTDVILTLKDNEGDENYDTYLTEYGLKDLVKRYSNYVHYPIQMMVTKSRQKPKPEDAGDDYQPEYEQYEELETVNSMTPIWKRRKSEVSQEEYNEFYKSQFHDYADPARVISVHAEGALSYDVLLFIPSRAPFDLWSKDYKKGLELYSSNVLIMEKCEDLLPDYFNFVRGVVDSQDLSLNISRKMLKNDREDYEKFWDNFGRTIKYGIYTSYGMNKDTLGKLLLFYSAKEQKMVTLAEYIEAMPEDQKAIYYAAGESTEKLGKMPMVKAVLGKGYDVLLCTQDVDDFCFQTMQNYEEKDLKNVANGDLDLESESDKTAAEEATKENEGLFTAMKDALGDKVKRVAVSSVLTDAPACLTADGPISLEMEKIMAGMPDSDKVKSERVLEINAKHPVFEVLKSAQAAGDAEKVKDYTDLLYNQALLVEGLPIDDPVAFAQEVCKLMK